MHEVRSISFQKALERPFKGRHKGKQGATRENGVQTIYNSGAAFAALKADGSVVTWGKTGEPTLAAETMARGGIAVKTNGSVVNPWKP